jgi:PKD repeat protein
VTVAHGGTGATTAPTALTNLGAQAAITVTAKTGSGGGNYTTTSATYVDVDGTNLTYTVTVASGRTLLVLVTGTCWGLAAPPVVGLDKDGTITVEVETGGTAPLALSYSFSSDGAAHTWKLRFHGDGVKDATILNTSAVNAPRMTFLVI